MLCSPSIVQCKPHRNQGQNTPFATEYTGSTLGSIRRPCRPGAFPKLQASSSRCGHLRWARPASRTHSTTTARAGVHAHDGRARRRRGRDPAGRDRVERTRSDRVGRGARRRAHRRSRARSTRAADAGPRVGARPRPRPRRRDARRSSARDRARRHRRRCRRAGCGDRSRSSRRRQSRARDPERGRVRVRVRPGRAPRHVAEAAALRPRGADRPRSRRSASTSTTPPDLDALATSRRPAP